MESERLAQAWSMSPRDDEKRLGCLDFFRGIAIVGVVTFHTFIIFKFDGAAAAMLAGLGVYGVQLFFLVSALTMCLMWDRRAGETHPARKFYIRRFFRIAPPFWIGIIGYLLLFGLSASRWSPNGVGWLQVATLSLFVHPFWPTTINAIVPGGWSIGVEVFFYAWFPAIIRLRADYRVYLLGAFAVYLLNIVLVRPSYQLLLYGLGYDDLIGEFLYFQFFNQAPIFLLEIALYKSELKKVASFAGVVIPWLGLSFALKFLWQIPAAPFFWTVVFAQLIFVSVAMRRNLSIRPINKLGELSYAIYLLHFAVIYGVELLFRWAGFDLHSFSAFTLALSVTLAICWILGRLLSRTLEKWSTCVAQKVVTLV